MLRLVKTTFADSQVPGTNGVLGQGAEEQKGETARLVTLRRFFALHCDCMTVLLHKPL